MAFASGGDADDRRSCARPYGARMMISSATEPSSTRQSQTDPSLALSFERADNA